MIEHAVALCWYSKTGKTAPGASRAERQGALEGVPAEIQPAGNRGIHQVNFLHPVLTHIADDEVAGGAVNKNRHGLRSP